MFNFFIKTKIVGGVNRIEQVQPEIYKNTLSYKTQREIRFHFLIQA